MANTYAPLVAGTTVKWSSSGGNHVLTGTSLSNASGRAGDKCSTNDILDATKGLAALLEIWVSTKVQSAPTAGLTLDVYLAFSDSGTAGTDNPGNLSGADAALANVDIAPQLVFVGSVVMSNNLGTGLQQQRFLVQPQDQFVIPILVNNTGQTVSSTGTDTQFWITPWYQQSS
jgi:hypothetical protein